ncbi:hypothetical protein SAMD00019534_125130 [Acytostelium subglobosum LB1]|uniref:hypothetical protein n=1 Tax=Acytostelium subglobosum LB1 TaxID=1410327 RepID=UPI000644D9EA|nr:hypothetical protein SAMD00019534_125130 [Acytostelium subglobosum LB1]GAM29337.1 hypothetical protein SAMD00019534_125130 [Acytostelium subglobosum LB1]|eukprot:XP_012747717.1 hypothetical protein SAMD00019534_125130 [Acytostelium subglobosum LB1]
MITIKGIPLCVVEVKNHDFSKGGRQIAGTAHRIFMDQGRNIPAVYGILTDGLTWVLERRTPTTVSWMTFAHSVEGPFKWSQETVTKTIGYVHALLIMMAADEPTPSPTRT